MRKALFALLIVFVASCSKKEDVIIPGNVPPPDHTIDSATLEIYLNKVYINILGREPINNEKADGLQILKQDNFSAANRKQFLDVVFGKPEYNRNLYNVARIEYLQNLDSTEIEYQIYLFNLLLQQPQYAPFYDALNAEVSRLNTLKAIMPDLTAGTLDHKGMLKRCVDNYFYDQINMGTENFVVSTFQNFLFRYPTTAELTNGKTMVDGLNANLFLQIGRNKNDYIRIFFDSDDYYEGQVRYIFRKYLFREPLPEEIGYYANIYKSTNDYKKLQKEFFATNEYAGL